MSGKFAFISICCLFQVIVHLASAQVTARVDSLNRLLEEAGEDTNKVRLLTQLAITYMDSDTAKTFSHARQAIELAEKLDDQAGIAKGYILIGDGYYYTQNFKPALEYLTKGLQISREIKDKDLQANALHDLGIVYTASGAYTIALEHLLKALKLNEELGSQQGIHAATSNLAYLYGSAKNYPKAIEYLHKSIEISKERNSEETMLHSLGNLGVAYAELGDYRKALKYYNSSLVLATKYEKLATIGLNKAQIAEANVKLQQYDSVQIYIDEARELGKKTGDQDIIQVAANAQAKYDANHGRYDQAIALLKQTTDTLEKRGMLREASVTCKNLRDIYQARGDYAGALAIADKINLLEDSLFRVEKAKNLDAIQVYYETEKKEAQIAALEEESKLKTRLNYMGLAVILVGAGFVIVLLNRMRVARRRMEAENRLQKEEKLRIKAELELKNRELASSVMYLSRKNDLLNHLKCHLEGIKSNNGMAELKDIHKMIDNSLSMDQDWEKFTLHFDNVHPDFFKKLQSRYPSLTPNELKECAYMKINLSTKEVASLLNISPDSVKIRRHRIKKKIGLPTEENLPEFIASL